ncbi:MAG: hypothetical protein ACE5OZ_17080 [Candidatus Heimdallarchaeota archaeon]
MVPPKELVMLYSWEELWDLLLSGEFIGFNITGDTVEFIGRFFEEVMDENGNIKPKYRPKYDY